MQQRVIMVVGMHRSGTSLVSQALESLGVVFGGELIQGDKWNERGYYEYRPSVDASLQIFRKLNRRPFQNSGLRPLPSEWLEQNWVREIEDWIVEQLEKDLNLLNISMSKPFGLKDPHATLLLPLWERVFERLQVNYSIVLSVRHPGAVADSVLRRDSAAPLDTERMWLLYNLSALCHGHANIRKIVDYSRWAEASDSLMEELADALGLNPGMSFTRSPYVEKLSHAGKDATIRLEPVAAIYQRLRHVQPGQDGWDKLCQDARLIGKTLEMFGTGKNGSSTLEPLVEEGRPIKERGALNSRRRRVLFPDTSEKIQRYWPPTNTLHSDPVVAENASVAFIVIDPPELQTYSPVARCSAEILSALSNNGVKPTILDLSSENRRQETQDAVKTLWSEHSVAYERIDSPSVPAVRGPLALAAERAYRLYEWLKNRHFDVIHAPDFHGSLYFCLRAKEQGIAFTNTRFVVHPVNGILQNLLDEYKGINDIKLLPRIYIEKSSLELADTVSLSGRSTLRKLLDSGIALTRKSIEYYPYPLDHHAAKLTFDHVNPDKQRGPIKRILCLPGTSRRGIALFCRALNRGVSINPSQFSIALAVRSNFRLDHEAYISALTSDSDYSPIIETVDDPAALVQLLREGPKTLCVFPVIDKWNYYQLKELVIFGVPILVADRSAGSDIFTGESIEKNTCAPLPDAITKQISILLESHEGIPRSTEKVPLPASWATPLPKIVQKEGCSESPLVTVCLMHFERPHLVDQALASVKKQTYSNYEVILVDDGSIKRKTVQKLEALKAKFKKNGWRVIRQQNRYLGAARNSAAMVARGRYLYFLDDDNILKPHALETFVKVAQATRSDVVAAFSDVFEGKDPPDTSVPAPRRIIQIGDDLSYGFFRNAFGDSNALIRRSAFLALGGNSEDYAVGLDDMEFFARAILNGCRLSVVPEALYWARQMPTRLRNLHFNPRAGSIRVCRAYLPHVPDKMRPMLLLVSGVMEMAFEGKNITMRAFFTSIKIRIGGTRIGGWLRSGFSGSVIHRLLVWLRLNDS